MLRTGLRGYKPATSGGKSDSTGGQTWTDPLAAALFSVLDDDRNDLIDSLELLSTLCLLSSMSNEEKIQFIFALYDFDYSRRLSVEEVFLALRSALSGLCKVANVDPPVENLVQAMAAEAFRSESAAQEEAYITLPVSLLICINYIR